MHPFNILSRRAFLDRSLKIGMGVALSTLTDIPLVMKRALAEGNIGLNGKKLLFIFLRGANDGLNTIIPALDPSYATSRPNIGIPFSSTECQKSNLDVPYTLSGTGTTFPATDQAIPLYNGFAALHPSLRFAVPAYNAGDLALVHRVAYPNQSRSHFDSQNYWENATPNNDTVRDGIFYRTMVQSGLTQTNSLTGVSIQSALPFSLQGQVAMTNLVDPTRYDLIGIPNNTAGNAKVDSGLVNSGKFPFAPKLSRELLNAQYNNLTDTLSLFAGMSVNGSSAFAEVNNTFRDAAVTGTAFSGDSAVNTDGDGVPYYLFPTSNTKNGGANLNGRTNATGKYVVDTGAYGLFTNLKAAALILNNTDAIIAGTETGSFDTHQTQGGVTGTHANLLRRIGWAIYALRKYFLIYGKGGTNPSPGAQVGWNDVIVVTLSEFGRTTIQNASLGTDHAEASTMLVAGGSIQGRNKNGIVTGVFGCNPSDAVPWVTGGSGTMFAASGSYVKRAVDYRSMLGLLIRQHLGATQNQLNQIIPGYANVNEHLGGSGGTGIDGTHIMGELPII